MRISIGAGPLALRHRNYRLFFTGQLISMIGTWMQSVAQSWLVYRLTGSSLSLGLVGFVSQIPVFLVAPIGGLAADRFPRRRILVATQCSAMALALLLAFLTLTGRIELWHVLVLGGLLGVVNAFDIPGRQAFVVEMVGRKDLPSAIALNSSIVNGARIVGPAVAGLLVAAVGEGWCFLLNGASYVAVIVGLLLMRIPPETRRRVAGSAGAEILEGFRFVVGETPVRSLVLLLGLMSLMGMPYAVLMPIFAERVLGGGARGLGILMGASGAGALLGAIALVLRRRLRGLSRWVALSSAGFGLALIAFSLSRTFWLSVLILVPLGCAMMVQMTASNTLVQSMVPDELRGRVMSVYSMVFMGMGPFGTLLAGALAASLGAPLTTAIGGAVCVAGAAAFGWFLPVLRVGTRRLIIAQQMAGGDPPEEITALAGAAARS
jgi:MFS family permease